MSYDTMVFFQYINELNVNILAEDSFDHVISFRIFNYI